MTEVPVDDLMRLTRWAIRSWEHDPEYDDILAQAYLQAWQGYQSGVKKGHRKPLVTATAQAKFAAALWKRAWYGDLRAQYMRERPMPIALVDLVGEGMDIEECCLLPSYRLEEEVLQRLWAEEVWSVMEQHCTPRQIAVLRRVILKGETMIECGAALGLTAGGAHNAYKRGMDRYRAAVGL